MKPKIIEFLRTKDYVFIEDVGQGGTGKTVLLRDETIDEYFVCKKYAPVNEEDKPKYFQNFLSEIKILYTLNHRNIVRVFSYHLYPDQLTGYIIMEYIKGIKIDQFILQNPERLNDVFVQVIEGFCNLELNSILHRDLRPENILVNEDGLVKIIDFGFGKKVQPTDNNEKSVSLNWRYSTPDEFSQQIYDIRTEIYFVGKMFEEIILEKNIENFKYINLLNEMIKRDLNARIQSFAEIFRKILNNTSPGIEFTTIEKFIYKNFAECISATISSVEFSSEYISDINDIIMRLEQVHRDSMLEEYIQNPASLGKCFIKGNFKYFQKATILVFHLNEFLKMIKLVAEDKKKIIINNLMQRIDSIEKFDAMISDLPF